VTPHRPNDLDALRVQLAELFARIDGIAKRVDEHDDALHANSVPAATSDQPGSGTEGWTCSTLAEWVEEVFAWHFTRDHETQTWYWCPRWWDHVEAVSRLTALWHAWEAMHHTTGGGAGLAHWYHELDHQLPILMGPHGPFRLCKAGARHSTEAGGLPIEHAPR